MTLDKNLLITLIIIVCNLDFTIYTTAILTCAIASESKTEVDLIEGYMWPIN